MNKKIIIAVFVLAVAILAVYFYMQKTGEQVGTNGAEAPSILAQSYEWSFAESEPNAEGIPYTTISLTVNGNTRVVGKYTGSCHVVEAGQTGILSEPADPGEISRAQCWFAGGGDEVGVFEEDGKTVVKSGELGEGDAENPAFRGNFRTIFEI